MIVWSNSGNENLKDNAGQDNTELGEFQCAAVFRGDIPQKPHIRYSSG